MRSYKRGRRSIDITEEARKERAFNQRKESFKEIGGDNGMYSWEGVVEMPGGEKLADKTVVGDSTFLFLRVKIILLQLMNSKVQRLTR